MSPAPDVRTERTGYELRLLIHHKVAGAVIGKGGEYIKKLREHDLDDITIPDRQSPERIIIVLAKSLDIVKNCLRDIMVRVDEVNQKVLNTTNSEARLLIHASHGGAVIGKGGSKVKELKELTGANVKVYTEQCPYSTDRVVAVMGEREGVVDCVTEIVKICRENPVKSVWRKYDTANFNVYFAEKYGGYPDFAFRGGAMAPMRDFDVSGYGAPPGSGGGGMGHANAGPRGDMYGYGDMYGGNGKWGMMGMGPQDFFGGTPRVTGGPVETVQLTVPEEVTGAVIGRNGNKIRSIKMDSGADISLDRDSNVDGEKLITITGNQNQVQMATFLLQQAVRNSPQGRKLLQKGSASS